MEPPAARAYTLFNHEPERGETHPSLGSCVSASWVSTRSDAVPRELNGVSALQPSRQDIDAGSLSSRVDAALWATRRGGAPLLDPEVDRLSKDSPTILQQHQRRRRRHLRGRVERVFRAHLRSGSCAGANGARSREPPGRPPFLPCPGTACFLLRRSESDSRNSVVCSMMGRLATPEGGVVCPSE